MASKLLIGVTGNIASGKSSVAQMLREKGCALIDADKVAHDLYLNNRPLVQQLVSEFGAEILDTYGRLNRTKLGKIVFGNLEAMATLNRIVHPVLTVEIRNQIWSSLKVLNRVVLDAALIVEFGLAQDFDYLIFVSANTETRLQRLISRNELNEEDAAERIRSQMPEEGKLQYADFVLKNESTTEYLSEQVDAVWDEIVDRELRDIHSDRQRREL